MSVRSEKGIPAPNPINAGQITRHAEGVGGCREEEGKDLVKDAGSTHSQ